MSRPLALVTGAGAGIGRACLAALEGAGFEAWGLDLAAGDDPRILPADVSDPEAVAAALAALPDRPLAALVNNAGIMRPGRLETLDLADLDAMLAVNLKGPFVVTRAALPRMGAGGAIVNIASELARLGRAGASGYCATKGAMLSATRAWARELAPTIRVNAVAPGPVDTDLLGFGAMSEAERALETANPMGRIGRPEEVAAVVAFLCSDAAAYVTGQCYGADGGAAMA